jgi:hypothetical protein
MKKDYRDNKDNVPSMEDKWERCCTLKIEIDKLDALFNNAWNEKRKQEGIIKSCAQQKSDKTALIMKALK